MENNRKDTLFVIRRNQNYPFHRVWLWETLRSTMITLKGNWAQKLDEKLNDESKNKTKTEKCKVRVKILGIIHDA